MIKQLLDAEPEDGEDGSEGYTITFPDGHTVWVPKVDFEQAFIESISDGEGLGCKVDQDKLNDFIRSWTD